MSDLTNTEEKQDSRLDEGARLIEELDRVRSRLALAETVIDAACVQATRHGDVFHVPVADIDKLVDAIEAYSAGELGDPNE